MKLFTTQIDDSLHERLKELANNKNMKIKGLVSEALEDLLKKYKEENGNGSRGNTTS